MGGSMSSHRGWPMAKRSDCSTRRSPILLKLRVSAPVGYRAPSWAFSGVTLDLIRKKGFLYDSSLQALDEPYEIVSRGQNTGLVELSIDWTLTETPYLGQNGHMPSPELLYQLYKDEFDGAYAEGTTFILTLHPYLSGHRAPMKHLEAFVSYMKSKPGVWFATCEQVARYVTAGKFVSAPSARRQAGRPVVLRHEEHRGLPERGFLSRGIKHRNLAVILTRR